MEFADVYSEHVWRIYGFIAYRVSSRSDAEDLTSQTFERALRAWSQFDPRRAGVATWLIAIARNLVIDFYRRDRSDANEPLGDTDSRHLPAVDGPEQSLGIDPALAAALAGLAPRDREVVALRYGGDLTGPEIAELTGLTLANVQQILSRSLRRMRAELERAGAAPPT